MTTTEVSGDVEKAMDTIVKLAEEAPGREVPLVRFVRRMVDMGFTKTAAIRLLDELLDAQQIAITNRYNLVISA